MGIVMCFAAFGKLSDDVQCRYGAERLSSERQNWWLGTPGAPPAQEPVAPLPRESRAYTRTGQKGRG